MKKLISLFLAALMILTALFVLVACKIEPTTGNTGNTGNSGNGGNIGDGTTAPETPERESTDYLPTEMYGTKEEPAQYNILNWSCGSENEVRPGGWIPWEEADVIVMDGDRLGEAVFNRNAKVEERYGVEITSEYAFFGGAPDYMTTITADAQNSEGRFQLCISRAYHIVWFLRNEYLCDLNEQEQYLRTDKPWWVKDSVDSYTLGDSLYMACTEMLLRDKGATAAMFFNKDVAENYEELPNFYELVDSNGWTKAALLEAADLVASDLGGGEGMDSYEDLWGMVGAQDPVYYLYNAFGHKWARVNEDGRIDYEFSQDDGKTVTTLQDIFGDIMYADWYFNTSLKGALIPDGANLFRDGHALFASGLLKGASAWGTMQQEYGILPQPLLNELQEDYSSLVWMHHDSVLGIPKATSNTSGVEFSAVILEALSWESYYSVSPVFYEEIMYARLAKDTEDVDMVKRILATRSYDPGLYYDGNTSGLHVASNPDGYLQLSATGTTDVVSVFQRAGDTAIDCMNKINNLIDGKPYESN